MLNRMSTLPIKVVIFDLDDTLYEEINYVYSGFKAVSSYLFQTFYIDETEAFEALKKTLHVNGRGEVFDAVLKTFHHYSKQNVMRCLNVYRSHMPTISLSPEAHELLGELKRQDIPIYIVTDGNKIVQNRKIEALHVKPFIKKTFITHHYGKIHAKPSPYCFEKIATLEHAKTQEILYIADNPHKDFVGIKPLGFQTIRIKQGMFKEMNPASSYDAHHTINHIRELKPLLEQMCHKDFR